jgi:hypothetical protein
MKTKNITIIVRGTKGEIKKAIYDGTGKLQTGDANLLAEVSKLVATPKPAPQPAAAPASPHTKKPPRVVSPAGIPE